MHTHGGEAAAHVALGRPDTLALYAGAKLDVQLMKRSMPAGSPSFCRTMVLRRLHGHVGPLQNLQYRFHLLQVFAAALAPCHCQVVFSLEPLCLCHGRQCGKPSLGKQWLKLAAEVSLMPSYLLSPTLQGLSQHVEEQAAAAPA